GGPAPRGRGGARPGAPRGRGGGLGRRRVRAANRRRPAAPVRACDQRPAAGGALHRPGRDRLGPARPPRAGAAVRAEVGLSVAPTLFRDAARPPGAVDERLDERVRVVSPRLWLGLLAGLLVVAGVLVWSIVTTTPVEVQGRGVVQGPGGLERVQAAVSGEVTQVSVTSGQRVRAGDVLARIRGAGPGRPEVAVRARVGG